MKTIKDNLTYEAIERIGIYKERKRIKKLIDETFKDIKTDMHGFSKGINMRIVEELKQKITK